MAAPPTFHVGRPSVRLLLVQEGKALEGKIFLAANKKKEGVIETPSGLQYKVLKSGKAGGKTPLVSTPCLCHYRGKLADWYLLVCYAIQVAL